MPEISSVFRKVVVVYFFRPTMSHVCRHLLGYIGRSNTPESKRIPVQFVAACRTCSGCTRSASRNGILVRQFLQGISAIREVYDAKYSAAAWPPGDLLENSLTSVAKNMIRQFGPRVRGIRERVDSAEVVKTERTEVHGSLSPRNLISSFTGLILLEKEFALSKVSCN